jgi:hypothetical protein
MPVMTPVGTYHIDDSYSAILADEWRDDVEDDEYDED